MELLLNNTTFLASIQNIVSFPVFVTAVAALVTAIAGIFFNYWNLKNAKEQWITDSKSQKEQWIADAISQLQDHYLSIMVQERLKTYAPVLKTLGEVRDIPDPEEKHWDMLKEHPEILLRVADELLFHLYGQAGLLMEMDTRNSLLNAFFSCYQFQQKDIKFEKVVFDFYQARRKLRADLQLQDRGEPTKLNSEIAYFRQLLGNNTHTV